ncbi:MAG: PD-(D/E)XK nuclease family protein, partial [Nitrospiraceae bacterium]
FTSTAAAPVIQEPAVKAMLRLAWLPITGFYRAPVLDVVASPFYRSAGTERGGVAPRPDLWHLAVRALGITRGVEEWRRLATAGDVQAWVVPGEESEGAPMGRVGIGRTQLQLLWHRVSRLIEDCQALPSHGGVAELTEAFLSLASHHLAVPGLTVEVPDEPEPPNRLAALGIAIQSALEQLRQLDRLGAALGWEAWVRLFMKALERAAIPVAPDHHRGVRVLDAMAARGLPFRALFLLGLNERIFPRLIREDAFLRDRHRRVLDETLGYKIDEKLSGYEEEQLLFALLRQAARSRLYLLYQRADADGRSQAPSAYLGVFQRVGSIRDETVTLSRRFADRRNMPLFSPSFLTLEELALRLIMEGRDPSRVLTAAGRKADLFQSGWQALRTIESGTQRLGCHDGLTDPLDSYWRRLAARGVSPTPLEQYARCPFQYFAAQVLRLEPLRQQAVEELPAQAIGELCHAILRDCGRRLVAAGWPEKGPSSETLREQIGAVATEIFRRYEARHGTGYALTWRLAQETVLGLVIASLEEDQREYDESGYRPIGFEVEAEGMLESGGSPGDGRLKVHGRLDRLDRRINPPALRIVDYKYRQGGDMKSKDRDLLTAAIRGYSLQPPLYTLMTHAADNGAVMEPFADGVAVEEVEFRFLAPRWERIVERSRFDSAGWRAPDGQVRETVRHLLDGVRSGRFFILPDTYCDFCEYSAACRRFHGPTWWRAHSSAPAKALRRLRKQKVTGE